MMLMAINGLEYYLDECQCNALNQVGSGTCSSDTKSPAIQDLEALVQVAHSGTQPSDNRHGLQSSQGCYLDRCHQVCTSPSGSWHLYK